MDESKVLNNNINTGINEITECSEITVPSKARDENRKTGIDIIGDVPWGTHLCQFYKTKEDLLDILIPYFKTGLENNEFCMWVASEPVSEEEATNAMRKAVPDFDQYLKKGQIEILPHTEWYLKGGVFNLQRILNAWIDKLNEALSKGYDGMRATGNTAWLEKRDWKNFTNYEKEVNKAIDKYRMLAICPYSLDKCGASEIIDVIGNHKSAIIRREGEWEIIESAERKKAREEIKKAEEGFRTLIQNSSDVIMILKADMSVQYVSPAVKSILDYEPEYFIGKNVLDYAHPEDIPVIRAKFANAIKEPGIVTAIEFRIQHKNGSWVYLEVIANNLLENPNVEAIIVNARDITERKSAEKMLRISEQKFKDLTETTTDWIWEVDKGGVYIYASPKVKELLGYAASEIVGKTPFDLMSKEEAKRVGKIFKKIVIKKESFHRLENINRHKDGHLVVLETSGIPLFDEKGQLKGYRGIDRDITERKSAKEMISSLSRFPSENPNPVLRIDSRGSILFKNPSVDALLKKMKLSEEDISKILPDNLKAVIDKALKTKKSLYDLEVIAADKIYSYNMIPIVESGYVNLYARDVTEHKKAEAEIKESERRFRDLAESLPQLVWTCLPGGRCDFLSRQWIEYTGIPGARQLGVGWLKQLHPDDRKPTIQAWNETIKKDTNFNVEFRICRRDGVYRWFKTRAVAMRDANGKVIKWFGSNTDIDDLKKAERNIRREQKKTEKLFAELDDTYKKLKKAQKQLLGRERIIATGALAAGVAHEIRNPLAIIGMTVQYLQSKLKENDPKRELTEAIIRKVERLDRVTKELSSYGRTMDLNIRKHNLAKCLNTNLALVKPKCRVQKIKIKKKYSHLPSIKIDDEQMDKVFLNIMDNAIQAMPKGGILSVSTELNEKRDVAIVKIHNTGPTIKKKHLSHIFEPFYTLRKGKGTGLGLAIVHNITTRHDGHVAVLNKSSGEDKGVTFIISLPVIPPPQI